MYKLAGIEPAAEASEINHFILFTYSSKMTVFKCHNNTSLHITERVNDC